MPIPTLIPVESTNIQACGFAGSTSGDVAALDEYVASTGTLYIQFHYQNRIYMYRDVPVDVYQGLLASPSKGGYFHYNIRDQYETEIYTGD